MPRNKLPVGIVELGISCEVFRRLTLGDISLFFFFFFFWTQKRFNKLLKIRFH